MPAHLHVGGLVAAGFDASGRYLLTVSHSGRGVFALDGWRRIARDEEPAYPVGGQAVGIGPLEGMSIPISEIDYETGELHLTTPDKLFRLDYDSGMIAVVEIIP